MPRHFFFNPYRISAQLFLAFMAIILLTTAATGIPALFIIHNQTESNAWAMVGKSVDTTLALYSARASDMTNLALLTAQRPTLHRLIVENNAQETERYLKTLLEGAGLDLLYICGSDRQVIAAVSTRPAGDVCQGEVQTGYRIDQNGGNAAAWLVSSQPVETDQEILGRVIVGQILDQDALEGLSRQTGLEYTLASEGEMISTSYTEAGQTWQTVLESGSDGSGNMRGDRIEFAAAGETYYAEWLPLDGLALEILVALPVTDLLAARRQLTLVMGGGLLLVLAVSSLVSLALSRRVSYPLGALRRAASNLRNGDLDTPILAPTRVTEVATVAYALEDARLALRHSLAELRREKAWIEHLLASIVEGIITLDAPGRVTFFSQGAERITGWSTEEALGRQADEVFQIREANQRFSQLIPDPGRQQRVTILRRDGRQVLLAITGAHLAPPEAGKARVVLVLRDVSDEEAVHQLLGGFLSNITHEFRTPLSALAASIELLMDQLPDLEPGELNELLVSLHLGVLNLQTLIDNLLEGSSIEAGRFKVSPRPADFRETVGEVTGMIHSLFEKFEKRLVVELPDELPDVNIDPKRTAQVLVNLLSNAVKFGGEGGTTVLSAQVEKGDLVVKVSDDGRGIPPDLEKDLFHRFAHYASSGEKPQYGLGLGLSVVKAIIEAQGGQAGAANRPEGGATFWFTLPLVSRTEEVR